MTGSIMRQRAPWILAAVIVFATGLGLASQVLADKDDKPAGTKEETLNGVLIDTKCYSSDHNNIGNDHGTMKGCGTVCANMGIPVGLLVDGKKDGRVVVLIAPSKAFASYIGQTVRVAGTRGTSSDTIVPTKVEVKQDDGSYKAIDISGMM